MLKMFLLLGAMSVSAAGGCAVSAKNQEPDARQNPVRTARTNSENTQIESPKSSSENPSAKPGIRISQGSPADTVRIFYKNLRENHFREAMLMTNLRSAVEDLTDAEIQDLSKDFAALAAQVPAEMPINGEIITNNRATVTAKMTDEEGKTEIKEIELRRENENWIILTADEKGEAEAKKLGKKYFFNLRLDVHHAEAQNMMERIAKAQMIYAMQNNELFADMQTLISQGLLPEDINTSDSTGYNFKVVPAADKKKYFATAEPAAYGKSGKLSFLLETNGAGEKPRLKYSDNKGLPMKN